MMGGGSEERQGMQEIGLLERPRGWRTSGSSLVRVGWV